MSDRTLGQKHSVSPDLVMMWPIFLSWWRLNLRSTFVSRSEASLPVGMGIKGGIARKLLKEKYGRPEPPGQCDIDVLLFVQTYSPEVRPRT